MMVPRICLAGPVAVIGDIHGDLALLDALLERLPDDCTLVVTGDVCDRGPDTRGVMERLLEREAIGVLGNHDLWFRDWALGRGFDSGALSRGMGGVATLTSYGVDSIDPAEIAARYEVVPRRHAEWLASRTVALGLEVEGERYWVTHAGIPAHLDFPEALTPAELLPYLVEEYPSALLWPKGFIPDMQALDRPVIMGHQPQPAPLDFGHIIAVDTGAGRGGYLSALLLPERRFVSGF